MKLYLKMYFYHHYLKTSEDVDKSLFIAHCQKKKNSSFEPIFGATRSCNNKMINFFNLKFLLNHT